MTTEVAMQHYDAEHAELADDELVAQLDALDDLSLKDPNAYFQLLSLMEPRLHAIQSIDQLKEGVTADVLNKDSTASIDLDQSINQYVMIDSVAKERTKVLEQLSRAKMNFLLVQTKRLLIESLMPLSAPAPVKTDLEIRVAEQSINDAKMSLASNKKHLSELTREIKSKAQQFTVDYDQLINRSSAFQDEFDPDEFARLTKQMIDCGLDPNVLENHEDEVIDRLINDEESTIADLEAQIKQLDEEIESQTQEITNDEHKITQLQKQLDDDPPINYTINPAELEWYQGIVDAVSNWNGISIISAQSERSLQIQISPVNQSNNDYADDSNDLVIEVDVNPHNVLQFNGGVICSGQVDDAVWDRLLDTALDTQDLPGFLRALQQASSVDQQADQAQPMEQ